MNEVLARGRWNRDELTVRWDAPLVVDSPLVEEAWAKALAEARAAGKTLFNGKVAGLSSFEACGTRLELALRATDYRTFIGTNLSEEFRRTGGERADPLGLSVVVLSGEKVLLHRRGEGCFEWPLAIDTPGGHLEPGQHPFFGVLEELEAELGVSSQEVEALHAIGLVRIAGTEKPQLVVEARVRVSVDEVRSRLLTARERFETSELLPLSVGELASLLSSNERISPAGRSAIELAAGLDGENSSGRGVDVGPWV